jgi:hypothetical protein
MRWSSLINNTCRSKDHWKIITQDLETRRGILPQLKKDTKRLGDNDEDSGRGWKELCYRKLERLGDEEYVTRWWQYNFV